MLGKVVKSTNNFDWCCWRGLSEIRHFRDIHSAKDFVTKPDSFFYIFGYNSKSGLAPPQGEIRVGAKHQATLPKCIRELPAEVMKERNPEDCVWRPKSVHYVLLEEYLMAARSVYAYRSICLTNYQENEIQAIDKDEAVQKALDSVCCIAISGLFSMTNHSFLSTPTTGFLRCSCIKTIII